MSAITMAWANDYHVVLGDNNGRLTDEQIERINVNGGAIRTYNSEAGTAMPRSARIFDATGGEQVCIGTTDEEGNMADRDDVLTMSYEALMALFTDKRVARSAQRVLHHTERRGDRTVDVSGWTMLIWLKETNTETGEITEKAYRTFLTRVHAGLYLWSQHAHNLTVKRNPGETSRSFINRQDELATAKIYQQVYQALLSELGDQPLNKAAFDLFSARAACKLFTPAESEKDIVRSMTRYAQTSTTWNGNSDREYDMVDSLDSLKATLDRGAVALCTPAYVVKLYSDVHEFIMYREIKRADREAKQALQPQAKTSEIQREYDAIPF